MTFLEALLPEFDLEMSHTRKVLERLPDDKLDWKPHPKSNSIGWNANHVADMVNWLAFVLATDSLDIAPVGGEPYIFPTHATTAEILSMFDRNVDAARAALASAKEEDLDAIWTLSNAGQKFLEMPRRAAVRNVIMNHIIHHRAHLCVYLRLNDLPVPGLYGPSGDE